MKNLWEHVKRCVGSASSSIQLQLQQCMTCKPNMSKKDQLILKRKQVEYCVDGYHSFRSVEHKGLIELLQTCVDFGSKYGKFDITESMLKRNTISRETAVLADQVKAKIIEQIKSSVDDGTLSLCLDMYTDDYRKKSYLDIHASWIERDFTIQHSAIAVRHFGSEAHTAVNISAVITGILDEYSIPELDTPVTTDHGSNIVAALRNSIRLDCSCHRLHTVLETAWRDTRHDNSDAAAYETAVSELCRFVKQSTGVQEQLPKSLKHSGDTRPWVSLYRSAESVESSYEALVTVLSSKSPNWN